MAARLYDQAALLRPDLHMHSTGSDGRLDAAMVVARARMKGVNLIALTDHDSLAGLPAARAAAERLGIGFIPGVEISAEGEQERHILGYYVHDGMAELNQLLSRLREDRERRKGRFLKRLHELSMPIGEEEIPTPIGTAFSRSHLAAAMVHKGYAKDISDAFNRWIGVGKPAYIARMFVAAEEVFALLTRAGAVPVLAHPGMGGRLPEDYGTQLMDWIKAGMMGIEAHHPSHSAAQRAAWEQFARQHGLLVTGGSDFHAPKDKHHGDLGEMLARWPTASQDAAALLQHAARPAL